MAPDCPQGEAVPGPTPKRVSLQQIQQLEGQWELSFLLRLLCNHEINAV